MFRIILAAMPTAVEIGRDAFATARAAERERARALHEAAREAARRALDAARDIFVEEAEALYASGEHAGAADADRLDDLAERTLAFARSLAPLLHALEVARDQAAWRGPAAIRVRSRFDQSRLAAVVGEAIAQEMLSETAAALFGAAIRAAGV
jgi:hypothetical protein